MDEHDPYQEEDDEQGDTYSQSGKRARSPEANEVSAFSVMKWKAYLLF
jgi:hypothetical protein